MLAAHFAFRFSLSLPFFMLAADLPGHRLLCVFLPSLIFFPFNVRSHAQFISRSRFVLSCEKKQTNRTAWRIQSPRGKWCVRAQAKTVGNMRLFHIPTPLSLSFLFSPRSTRLEGQETGRKSENKAQHGITQVYRFHFHVPLALPRRPTQSMQTTSVRWKTLVNK